MLMALISAQRVQTLHLLSISLMKKLGDRFIFSFASTLKTSRPGIKLPVLEFKSYPVDRKLCIYTVLKEYLSRRKVKGVKSDKLFVSLTGKHLPVSSITISRWIKTVMSLAGIDTDIFKAHSTRSAATSKAKEADVPIEEIMKQAGWSQVSTFATFYDKKVDQGQFARAVLKL